MHRMFASRIQTPEQGARPSLYAATAAEVSGGSYCGPSGWLELKGTPGPARVARAAHDEAVAQGLWNVAEQLTATRFRSEEHTSELQSLMRTSYAVFCLKKKKTIQGHQIH